MAQKPHQNAYLECFNRSYREEILNASIITSLAEVRTRSEEWRVRYYRERSHQSLDDEPPMETVMLFGTTTTVGLNVSGYDMVS